VADKDRDEDEDEIPYHLPSPLNWLKFIRFARSFPQNNLCKTSKFQGPNNQGQVEGIYGVRKVPNSILHMRVHMAHPVAQQQGHRQQQ